MKKTILFITILFLVTACSTNRQNTKTKTSDCINIQLLKTSADSLRIDYYVIDSLKIVDDCLEVFVNYSGGCGNASFDLFYTNRIMESIPPKTVLYLAFTDDDPCRNIETKKLTFSLDPFKRFADHLGIYLKIAGTDKEIFYKYLK